MNDFRTDLAMERTAVPEGLNGVTVDTQERDGAEITWVRIESASASARLGKPQGCYWTLTHPRMPLMLPEERMSIAAEAAQVLRILLPPEGDIMVLGLGNRRMTSDALGDRVVSGIMVTRHMKEKGLRSVCAMSPGVLGVTGVESAELALGLTKQLRPAAIIVVDALAAMETSRICTTIQITDTGIHPGSGVGNHRKGITAESLSVPVVAVGIPMVVYASTIVRDALEKIMAKEAGGEDAHLMAEKLTASIQDDLVVTPRGIDELVQSLADMLALAINHALQPDFTMEELSRCLH
ncbi:MAG: GPR endopeptidase [Christensenellaceae bacterium]|nr:GPR endopeptidase [Christensenellaceae bacterium]